MKRFSLMLVLSVLMIASMVLAACQPATTPTPEAPAEQPTTAEQPSNPAETQASSEPTQAPATEAAPAEGDVIRYGVLEDMTSTNVWALYDETDSSAWNYYVQSWQWPTVYGLSDQRFQVVPNLADGMPSDFTQEGDFYTSTVKLKDGLLWSDGSPMTADDVAFTANTVLKFRLGLNWLSEYNPDYLDHVEAVDPLTVKYYFKSLPGLAIWQFGTMQGLVVSKAYWEPKIADAYNSIKDLDTSDEANAEALTAAVDTLHKLDNEGEPTEGAWKLSKWEPGAFAETTANPNYHAKGATVKEYENGAYYEAVDGKYETLVLGEATGPTVLEYTNGPHFNSALYTLYGSMDAGVLALRNDDIDFLLTANGVQQGFIPQLQEDSNIKLVTTPNNGFRYLGFNYKRPGLDNPAVHQALACMIDLDFLTNRVLQGQALPVYTLVPEGNSFWYNKDVTKFCQGETEEGRVTKAVQILKDAGFTWTKEPAWDAENGSAVYGEGLTAPDGTKLPAYTLLAPSAGYDPLRATTAVYIEQWARTLGMDVKAQLTAFNNILTAVYDTGEYDMFILGWGLSIYPDYICTFFDQTNGNPYNYVSEELKTKCDDFLAESDMDKAQQKAFDIQNLLATELPYITLFTTPVTDAYRNIEFPYTDVLGGVGPLLYGLPTLAMPQ